MDNQQIFNDWINSFFYNNTVNMPYVFLFTDFHSPEKTFIFSRSLTSNLIIDYKKTFKPIYDTEDIDQDGNTREVIKSSIVVGVEDTIQQLGYVNASPSLITDQNKNDNANIPVPHLTIPIVSKEDSQEFFMYLIPMDEHCYKIEK